VLRGATIVALVSRFTVGAAVLSEEGWASFYARSRAGAHTASGERYDPKALVAAHPTLAFGTRVRVTRVKTGKAVVVRVIDRMPATLARRRGYIIDLSRAAAESLDFIREGTHASTSRHRGVAFRLRVIPATRWGNPVLDTGNPCSSVSKTGLPTLVA
jgi:rare lipoprotein A (peptidoglycan hydrolase)